MMKVWQQDWIARWALYSPSKLALSEQESGMSIDYSSLNQCANAIASSLKERFSIDNKDRIAVLADFSISYVALFSAAQKLGFAIVPLNYRLAAAEITDIIADATPKIIFCESKYSSLIDDQHASITFDIASMDEFESVDSFDNNQVEEDQPIFILYTSGTTGKAKGVKYTHKMAFWNSINTALSLNLNSQSRTLNVMPPFHTGGWNVLLLPFLHHGAFTILAKKFEPSTVLNNLSTMNCTLFMGVPTMLSMMASDEAFDNSDFSSLDYIIVGGESMPIPLIEKYSTIGISIRQGYGMTEVGPNITSLHQEDAIRKKGSIGRPNFYVNHRIINEEGRDVVANEQGELWLQGPMVTPGYWHNAEADKAAFSDDGLWFKTGDIVVQDEEAYLFVVDRLKNMYISGAENVYPAEVERIIRLMPQVIECAVLGVKDEKWGEVGKAFVVSEDKLSEQEVKDHCAKYLAKFKIPKYVEMLETLPKSHSGKIDRNSLKNL